MGTRKFGIGPHNPRRPMAAQAAWTMSERSAGAAPQREDGMLKQLCFFRKRPDMSMEEFMDYYENHHSKLGQKIGKPSIPNAVRYVRRYLTPVKNPVTGEIHDSG